MIGGLQHFLRGNGRPWAVVALGIALAGPVPTSAQTERTEAETREELENLRQRMQAVQDDLEADRSERSEAEQRLERLDREIAGLTAAIREVSDRQSAVREEIDRLEEEADALDRKLEAQKEQVARLAYSAYVMGRQSQLKLFLNQRSPAAINRMLGYHDYVVSARAETIGRINDWAAEVAALAEERRAREEELAALKSEHQAKQDALQARRGERQVALAALKERITSREGELSRLEENEKHLETVLRELQEYLAQQSAREPTKGAFRDMRGKLSLPVSAPIVAGFGDHRSTGVRWDGIMFRPDGGSEVKSIYEGRVVFADWLRGFGLLLIIDHGDGFMSLYSHNESLFKQVGDWVGTKEVIATVGTSGGLDKPGLYFEIRHDGEPQNPLSWCQRA